MALNFDALNAELTRNTDLKASILAAFAKFAAEVEASKNDPIALQAAVDGLRANDDEVAAAIMAGTPAARRG